MKAMDLMKREVKCCAPSDSLNEATRIMWDHDYGVVPVVDSARRLVGVITDRDICMAAYLRGGRLRDMSVADTMSRSAHSCTETDDVEAVHRVMRKTQIRRLPVLNGEGQVVGLVGLSDLAGGTVEAPAGARRPDAEEFVATFRAVTRSREPAGTHAVTRSPGQAAKVEGKVPAGAVQGEPRGGAPVTSPQRRTNKSVA